MWGKVRSGRPGQGSWTAVPFLLGTFCVEMGWGWRELGRRSISSQNLLEDEGEGTRRAVGCSTLQSGLFPLL